MDGMSANDLLKKVRKIEIKTRALSHQIFAGEYHSAEHGISRKGDLNGRLFRGNVRHLARSGIEYKRLDYLTRIVFAFRFVFLGNFKPWQNSHLGTVGKTVAVIFRRASKRSFKDLTADVHSCRLVDCVVFLVREMNPLEASYSADKAYEIYRVSDGYRGIGLLRCEKQGSVREAYVLYYAAALALDF